MYERSYHVFSESKRVYDFKTICDDNILEEESKVKKLGELMNDSHFSCRDLYECSSEELDELT